MHIGGSVRPPAIIYSVKPTFNKEDGKAGQSLSPQVYLWVDERGIPSHIRIIRSAGSSADQKIIAAVRQYKFKPATQNGKPVTIDLYIEVNIDRF